MKKILSLIFSVLIGFSICLAPAFAGNSVMADETESYIPAPVNLTTRSDFEFGINTHGSNYAAYPENYLEQQIHAVARSGSKWIRFGGSIPDDGDWTYLDTAVGLCNKYGLKIVMVIQPSTSYGLDYITLTCRTFAYRYNGKNGRGYVDVFQVWNEICSYLMKEKYGGSAPDGVSEDCYFTIPVEGAGDLPEYLEYFTAAEQGIHSKDCSSKFMVNFAQTHCGMITYFLKKGLKIDLVGWDLYASKKDREESARNMYEIYDIVEQNIYNKYKVPVILCETNVDMRTLSTEEKSEASLESYQRLIDNLYLAYNRSWLKGAIIYELLDQPARGTSPEASYGLIRNPDGGIGASDTKYEKPIYKEIQRLINGNENLKLIKRSSVNLKPYEKLLVDTADDSHLNKKDDDTDAVIDTPDDNGEKQDNGSKKQDSSADKDNKKKDSTDGNKKDSQGSNGNNSKDTADNNTNNDVSSDSDSEYIIDVDDDFSSDYSFDDGLDGDNTPDDTFSDDSNLETDPNEVVVTAPDQVKVIKSKKNVYKLPWLFIIITGAGLLAAGTAVIIIYLRKSKK